MTISLKIKEEITFRCKYGLFRVGDPVILLRIDPLLYGGRDKLLYLSIQHHDSIEQIYLRMSPNKFLSKFDMSTSTKIWVLDDGIYL